MTTERNNCFSCSFTSEIASLVDTVFSSVYPSLDAVKMRQFNLPHAAVFWIFLDNRDFLSAFSGSKIAAVGDLLKRLSELASYFIEASRKFDIFNFNRL
jgi:hypothetical protein